MSINLSLGHTQLIRDECALRGLTCEQTAYVLATAFHETGHTMQPVAENLRYTSAERIRAVWPSRFASVAAAAPFVKNPQGLANKVYGGRMGNVLANDGWTYRGRGHVQITGRQNYVRAGDKLGLALAKLPDLALQPDTAARVLVRGMQDGWFTGAKLADYIGATVDYRQARRIVNVMDRAEDIAALARDYEAALAASVPVQTPALPPAAATTFWQSIIAALTRHFSKGA